MCIQTGHANIVLHTHTSAKEYFVVLNEKILGHFFFENGDMFLLVTQLDYERAMDYCYCSRQLVYVITLGASTQSSRQLKHRLVQVLPLDMSSWNSGLASVI